MRGTLEPSIRLHEQLCGRFVTSPQLSTPVPNLILTGDDTQGPKTLQTMAGGRDERAILELGYSAEGPFSEPRQQLPDWLRVQDIGWIFAGRSVRMRIP